MKTRLLHSVILSLLLANLLVGQVILNFFHTHHSEVSIENYSEGTEVLHTSAEKCYVCSLHIVHELFYHEAFLPEVIFSFASIEFSIGILPIKNSYLSTSGRSPPAV